MEELSIEQKAKAYDKAINVEKSKIKNNKDHVLYEEDIIDIFSELKENKDIEDDVRRRSTIQVLEYARSLDAYNQYGKVTIDKNIAWLEKQGKQKPANNVKPKFHQGEWITNGEYTWKVISVSHLDYTLQNQCGHRVEDTIDYVNKEFHLWTIQDAKDGDVLVDKDNNIGIYKEIEGIYWDSYIYIGCDGELRGVSIGGRHEQIDTHPATKEQLDKLFAKMKEAGLGWNDEKKELKKIEDEPKNFKQQVMDETTDSVKDCISQEFAEWSEEDENILEALIHVTDEYEGNFCMCVSTETMMNWLKSLKQRIDFELSKSMNGKWYSAHYIQLNDSGIATFNKTVTGSTAVDAAFKMVCWLKENNKI